MGYTEPQVKCFCQQNCLPKGGVFDRLGPLDDVLSIKNATLTHKCRDILKESVSITQNLTCDCKVFYKEMQQYALCLCMLFIPSCVSRAVALFFASRGQVLRAVRFAFAMPPIEKRMLLRIVSSYKVISGVDTHELLRTTYQL